MCGSLLFFIAATIGQAEEEKNDSPESGSPPAAKITAAKKWTVLQAYQPKAGEPKELTEKSSLVPVEKWSLTGPRPGDPFLFGNFATDAGWGTSRHGLHPMNGKNAAVVLADADEFELEGVLSAEGLGGWFILTGWKEGHGYMIYNVTLKESGSPWLLCEFRGNRGLEDTHRELNRHLWKGNQPFRLSVANKTLQLDVGPNNVLKDVPLPNYAAGSVLMGTYDTRYGAKPLRVQSLRIRSK